VYVAVGDRKCSYSVRGVIWVVVMAMWLWE
jgi:hypothetical protein